MKYRLGRWAALSALIVVLLGWGFGLHPFSQAGQSLQVNTERLVADLQTLAQERYTEAELADTRSYISRQLNLAGYAVEQQPFELQGVSGSNLIATRPGTDLTAGTFLVGSHYDSVQGSPGADDNASAVAAALEVARLFAHKPTSATLKVVFFDQEEQQPVGEGILGSTAFVLDETNLVGLRGAIVLEMVGYTCDTPGCQQYPEGLELDNRRDIGDFIGVIGDTQHPELLAAFAGPSAESELADGLESDADSLPIITLTVPISAAVFLPDLFRSDHAPFWIKGIGAVMVTDTADFRNPNYHQPTDTLASLDIDFLTRVTQKVVLTVETLLNS